MAWDGDGGRPEMSTGVAHVKNNLKETDFKLEENLNIFKSDKLVVDEIVNSNCNSTRRCFGAAGVCFQNIVC
ncbi:hypothetical protein E3N88_04739 [Mikania micrantha]|uniref:Uncharacterized protein n=1 Tax=Mikania micrantha TaxID=192012 RepID=A0A5N6PXC4_9ASTR|nr:hypothetical protein E3N88_04739 [Mikania micrantha]